MLHEIGLAALILKSSALKIVQIKKKHASEAWCFFLFALFIRDPERIRFKSVFRSKQHKFDVF